MSGELNIEALADAILRASGSGLKYYTMPSTREAILKATQAAVDAGSAPTPLDAELIEALEALSFAEQSYRQAHDLYGDGSREAGREWDLMRRAGDAARQSLALALARKGGGE